MKRENGSGSVSRVSDKRRKPWKVVITTGKDYDPERDHVIQRRKLLGYYPTRTEAENALALYRMNPYDLNNRRLTLTDLYESWSAVHYEKVSASTERMYRAAYKNIQPLHDLPFSEIRPHHMEKCIREIEAGSRSKEQAKQLLNHLCKYALKCEIVTVNYAAMCDGIKKDEPKIIRTVFTEDEESVIWKQQGELIPDMILVGLYSGWRPGELCLLDSNRIDLTEWTMQGGIKTKAGKDRIVPIHDKIKPIIERRLSDSGLFQCQTGKMSYQSYQKGFQIIMGSMGIKHTPHDTRHSFVTRAKEYGMNEHILKLIVGHSEADLTERVYTHRGLEEMRREMSKIP